MRGFVCGERICTGTTEKLLIGFSLSPRHRGLADRPSANTLRSLTVAFHLHHSQTTPWQEGSRKLYRLHSRTMSCGRRLCLHSMLELPPVQTRSMREQSNADDGI
jgi:hypothetical protein